MPVELFMNDLYVSNDIRDVLKELIDKVVPIDHHLNLYQCLDGKVMLKMSLRDNKHRIDLTNPYQINIIDEFAKNNPVFIRIPCDEIGEIYMEYNKRKNEYTVFYRIRENHVEAMYLVFILNCLSNNFGPYISLIKTEFYPVESRPRDFFRMLGIPGVGHQMILIRRDTMFYDGPKNLKLLLIMRFVNKVCHTAGTQVISSTGGYFVLNIAELQNTPVYERFINTVISNPKFLSQFGIKSYKVKE